MRLVLFTLTSPAPPKFPFYFSSHLVQFPLLLVSRPFSFIYLYIYLFYLVASFFFVGFFCIRFCSMVSAGWLWGSHWSSQLLRPITQHAARSGHPRVLTLLHWYCTFGAGVGGRSFCLLFWFHVNTLMHADTSAVIGLMSCGVSFSLSFSLNSLLCNLTTEKNCSY